MDRAMPMGCSISCTAFEHFSLFLEWMLKCRVGPCQVIHYLDDFLFCGKPGTAQCEHLVRMFRRITKEFGVPLADEKTKGPCTVITSLGIELDTIQQ